MRMNRPEAITVALMIALSSESLWAQEERPPARSAGFFRERQVSFWREPREKEGSAQAPNLLTPKTAESVWAEPIRTSDGRTSVYVPPKAVLEFLENPTEESGRAYLAWQRERMTKIARAAELLGRLSGRTQKAKDNPVALEEAPAPPMAAAEHEKPPPPPTPAAREEILYFKRDGCPHCRTQDLVFQELAQERPDVKVRVLTPGTGEQLWKTYGVTVVPTVILVRPDGTELVARGYTPKSRILAAFGSCQGGSK